jgi:dienelactone hydrolase
MTRAWNALSCLFFAAACSSQAPSSSASNPPGTDIDGSAKRVGSTGIEAFPGSKIFMPPQTPAPGIVMLHGSEEGEAPFIPQLAQEIAKQGFVVVAFCWDGCPGMPNPLLHVPLEQTVLVGQWLKAQPSVGGKKVGLFGWSRGAEQSVLLTSLLASVDPYSAVYAHAPSDTIVASCSAAWTWHGQPLMGEPTCDSNTPGARIEVEKYPGPLFISAGELDSVWPSTRSHNIVDSRNRVPGLVTESFFWPNEDHIPFLPQDVQQFHQLIAGFFQRKLQ